MENFIALLENNALLLNTIWWITIGCMAVLFIVSQFFPYSRIAKILPLTIMFKPKENLDLDFQSVGYAMMHTTWLARISHYTICLDAFVWFIVFNLVHPIVGVLVLGLMAYQSSKIGERSFAISFTIIGFIYFGCSIWMIQTFSPGALWLLSISFLILTGFIRFIGHFTEPAPPMLLDDTDQFVKVSGRTINRKLIAMPIYGYVAEFASGLPNRLFIVQVSVMNQVLLGLQPKNLTNWNSINKKAMEVFKEGYQKESKLNRYYKLVNQK